MLLHYFFKSALHCSKCYWQGSQKIWKCLRRNSNPYCIKYKKNQNLYRNCILLSKLFWPTVRKIEIRGWRSVIHWRPYLFNHLCMVSDTGYGHPMKAWIKNIWKIGPMWQTKYASAVPKNLGVGVNFRPFSECYFLSGRP